jgi:hypothetical protein
MAEYVAYEIVPGWHQSAVRIAGPSRHAIAGRLWSRCERVRGATFRAITIDGEEFGTRLLAEQHGVNCLTERCGVCAQEFTTPRAGEAICPGCCLLIDEGRA